MDDRVHALECPLDARSSRHVADPVDALSSPDVEAVDRVAVGQRFREYSADEARRPGNQDVVLSIGKEDVGVASW
jgi:hypothetical protein